MDDLGDPRRELSASERLPIASLTHAAPCAARPFANTTPSGPAISTPSPSLNGPRTSVTPAGSNDVLRSMSARRAPSSTVIVPLDADARRRSTACAPEAAGRAARTTVPMPGSPRDRGAQHAVACRGGDHGAAHRTTRRDARRGELRRHAAAPALGAGAARRGFKRGVDGDDVFDQRGLGVEARVGGEHAVGVGEQHEQVGVDEVGDQRGEPVVVAEADLVVGDGVVLVDDRNHAELEQAGQRLARVQVLLAVHEVERREQHLAAHEAVGVERVVVDPHEPALADGGDGLQRRQIGRTRLVEADARAGRR